MPRSTSSWGCLAELRAFPSSTKYIRNYLILVVGVICRFKLLIKQVADNAEHWTKEHSFSVRYNSTGLQSPVKLAKLPSPRHLPSEFFPLELFDYNPNNVVCWDFPDGPQIPTSKYLVKSYPWHRQATRVQIHHATYFLRIRCRVNLLSRDSTTDVSSSSELLEKLKLMSNFDHICAHAGSASRPLESDG